MNALNGGSTKRSTSTCSTVSSSEQQRQRPAASATSAVVCRSRSVGSLTCLLLASTPSPSSRRSRITPPRALSRDAARLRRMSTDHARRRPPPAPTTATSLTRFLIADAGVRGVRVHLEDTWRQIRDARRVPRRPRRTARRSHGRGGAVHRPREGRRAPVGATARPRRAAHPVRRMHRGGHPARDRAARRTKAGAARPARPRARSRCWPSPSRTRPPPTVATPALPGPGRAGVGFAGRAFEDYFRQSEQLPTRLLLAADDSSAAGLMLQKLPGDAGDEDGWVRAGALFDTLSPQELLDGPVGRPADPPVPRGRRRSCWGTSPWALPAPARASGWRRCWLSLGEDEAVAAVADGRPGCVASFADRRIGLMSARSPHCSPRPRSSCDAPDQVQ